ncbi:MAG: hypothetical protein JW715_13935 [Sedimentisphaerales bacterium]|nr:hypothetical protein [Sedimentisphaerales bacterium]
MGKYENHLKLLLLLMLILFLIAVFLPSKEKTYDWIFIYYMSYDNDLSGLGNTIIGKLQEGIVNSKIAVVVQADFADNKGMKRIALYRTFGKTKRKEFPLKNEDSADPNQLQKYFHWIGENFKAENYCIVFLDHGGKLNDMCRDSKPFQNQEKNKQFTSGKWLSATEVGRIVADFNQKTSGKVRLLFLQQCGRSAIQNLYNFTDAAEYILSSPVIVGVPNTYYTQTIKFAAEEPDITGINIAQIIMREDKDYTLYTLIENNELKRLPERISAVLSSFTQNITLKPPQSCSPIFEFEDEKFYDLKSYFQALSSANNNIAEKELRIFFDWCDNYLIVSKSLNASGDSIEASCCGLSVYTPSIQKESGRYNFLPLYQQTNLEKLFQLTVKE